MNKDILWVEEFRPSTVDDLVLPESIKDTFRNIIGAVSYTHLTLQTIYSV